MLMLALLVPGCSRPDNATLDLEIVYFAFGHFTGKSVAAAYVAPANELVNPQVGARVTATFRLDGNALVLVSILDREAPGSMSLVGTITALPQDTQRAFIEFDVIKGISQSTAPEISFKKGTVKIIQARFSLDEETRLTYEGFSVKEVLPGEPRMWK